MKKVIFLLIAFSSAPSLTHHNYAANYDSAQIISLEGIVTQVDWKNPHIEIFIDVEEDGEIFSWVLPTAAPRVASRNGMTAETVAVGERIVISGWPSRDGSLKMRARSLILANGTEWPLYPTWTGSREGGMGMGMRSN
tara:strand:- start:175 stop:588 length:414 start_codon:yes stop_codon:yes gene_type:complete